MRTLKNSTEIKKTDHAEPEVSRLKQEVERLSALLEISDYLASTLDLDELLLRVMEVTRKQLNAERCTVFLIDFERDELWSKIAMGVQEEIRFSLDKGIAGHVARTGEILNIKDAYADPRFNPEVDKKTGYRTRNLLTMPMRNKKNEIIGVFQVLNKKEGSFTAEDIELLKAISSIAATAIENASLYDELNQSFVSFVETLSITLDARDYITSGHSRRVTLYSVQVARLMRLPKKEIELIRYAALLHDIGKLGIPEIVLFKNKKLTEEEYNIIKRHAVLSKSILSKIRFQRHLKEIPQIAAAHHEKIDGSGYPQGLRGDEIPRGGKILALCDVFDALTSRRQYKDRMDIVEVMDILERETGRSFEPFVVYHFKNITLNVLIEILEFGHKEDFKAQDLELLRNYTLKDLIRIRKQGAENDEEFQVAEIFMYYYQRKYRGE
ncbi:metal dependent phosphohydrolase with GAF sensor [Caldithrix abyssi DSM 13497]|uniref:Metal dependent phosphohydrolase with GAF sensor n=2 Tax=Caldithrix abyssi DSM 13497 TaxID=880073 RepID=H1XRX6_CALAY|nr:metal dependent phosphohydrolase with GAF sensor [Caldithrix abyssi DSM 13497]